MIDTPKHTEPEAVTLTKLAVDGKAATLFEYVGPELWIKRSIVNLADERRKTVP